MELKLEVKEGFDLEKAVCNYGLFMTSPNKWHSSSKSFRRPLRLADGSSSVMVSITQSNFENYLVILIENKDSLNVPDQEVIKRQVIRMLKMTKKDEKDVHEFQEMYDDARKGGFGRLFRSPDVFEDIIKTFLLCNTSWLRTLQMSQALCELQAELHSVDHDPFFDEDGQLTIRDFFREKKRRSTSTSTSREKSSKTTSRSNGKTGATDKSKPIGNFPTSKELASLNVDFLKSSCRLGYRAENIISLARKVEDRRLKLEELENQASNKTESKKLLKRLKKLDGIGPFGAANIAMCLGNYCHIPIDSETIKHLREVHGRDSNKCQKAEKDAIEIYDKFAPYQCLAYWYEHCKNYEKQVGKEMSNLSPSCYHKISGIYLSNNTPQKRQKNI